MADASSVSTASPQGRRLVSMLDGGATYKDISSFLDGLSSGERLAEVLSVTGKRVGKLYDAVADGPPMRIEEFFPASVPDGKVLIYEGRNSLPMFSRFQKRFCRKGSDIVGYNHQTMSFVTGPGWFVLEDGDASHPNELLFNYTKTPPHFPPEFPAYKPNEKGFSSMVYGGMKDYCRRVARGVVVGAAYRHEKTENAWFSLTLP